MVKNGVVLLGTTNQLPCGCHAGLAESPGGKTAGFVILVNLLLIRS